MTVEESSGQLRRGVHLIDLVMLGAGTAIGAAIFTVLGPAAKIGGNGILIAVALAAVPMVVFALVYAWMSSAIPRTAASYEWQRQFTHPAFAFAVVWLRVLSNAVVMIVLARTLVNYLAIAVELPPRAAMFAVMASVFALNYFGVAIAARAQTILMLLLLAVFAIFVVSGLPHIRPSLFGAALAGGWLPVFSVLPVMIQLFLGIETATEVGEEVKDARRNVPLGIGLALALTVLVYVAVTWTALSLAGAAALAQSRAPLLAAARISLGDAAVPLIVGAAVLALTKSMNAIFLVFARFLYAMGRSGVLPAALGRVHRRWGTPYIATIVAFAACGLGLLLPDSLVFLLIAVSIPTMLKYFGSCLAAFRVADTHPEICRQARLPLGRGTVKILSVLGMAAALLIGALGITSDWRPYLLLLVWLALGMLYYAWRR